MTGSRITLQRTLPGLMAGGLGLTAGLFGLALDLPILGVGAGVLALAAGLAGLRLARQLDDQMTLHAAIEAVAPPLATSDALDEPEAESDEALVDRTTGLFSESFFRVALDSRIAAARRHLRPIAIVLLEVVQGLPASEPTAVEADLVSDIIKQTLREADTACRLRSGYFALLLEDTPENGAIWTVERMRRQLAESRQGLTIWAGIACYPAHAFTPDEILSAAEGALVSAREWRQDRIEVAVAAE
jgi:GGDEF domain-containing protein